jgi:hypothetical protein
MDMFKKAARLGAGALVASALQWMALADVSGKAPERWARRARAALPWRVGLEAARSLAAASQNRWRFLDALACVAAACASFFGSADVAFWAVALVLGAAKGALLERQGAKERCGRAWTALVSTSQLAGTLGGAGGSSSLAWGGPRPMGQGHPGWRELARRFARAWVEKESDNDIKSRRRLMAMALALSGSEPAARWLWRRRSTQRSMRAWALDLLKNQPQGSEGWEAASAMADLTALLAAGGQAAWESRKPERSLALMSSKELSESSIPLLWTPPSQGATGFGAQLQQEAALALFGDVGAGQWGWSSVDGEHASKLRLARALTGLTGMGAALGSARSKPRDAQALSSRAVFEQVLVGAQSLGPGLTTEALGVVEGIDSAPRS